MAEMNNALNDGVVPNLVCTYHSGYVPGDKYYVCLQERPPSILCAACALCCHYTIKVFEVSIPDNVVDFKCDCGNERCQHERFCYFFPDKDNTNEPDFYNFPELNHFVLKNAHKHTKEDEKKRHKFCIENPQLLIRRAAFYVEKKEYSKALFETYNALSDNPGYVSTIFSDEIALNVGPALGLMTEVQEGFLEAIKDLRNYEILVIAWAVMDGSKRLNEILELAKNNVDQEGRRNLSMLQEHFNFTFTPIIKEALDTKAASFEVIKMLSDLEYEYYLEHVDVKRETKARIYVGNMLKRKKKFDWMGLVVKAGCDGFHMYLCEDFDDKLSIQKDELKELIGKYLVKNKKN